MKGSILTFESSIKLCAKQAMLTTAAVEGKILQDPDVEIVQITDTAEAVIPVPTLPRSWLKTTISWLTNPQEPSSTKTTGATSFPSYLK